MQRADPAIGSGTAHFLRPKKMTAPATMPPLLAISCGPAVATWDYSAAGGSSSSSGSSQAVVEVDPFIATTIPNTDNGNAVTVFHPHGPPHSSSSSVSSLCWNHNDQVLASCSSSSVPDDPNVSLTHAASGTILETLTSQTRTSADPSPSRPASTSVAFGGKSRYLVVSDTSGCASVWDLKKSARVRAFRLPPAPLSDTNKSNIVRGCTAARIDPTDTYVAAASGWESDGALRLYKLREGKLAATLRDVSDGAGGEGWISHGGIGPGSLDFSNLDKSRVAVGTRDGTLLLWDIQQATQESSSAMSKSGISPLIRLLQCHYSVITGVSFSPINRVLLSSCSQDGSVSFHDVNMARKIQSFRPGNGMDGGKNGTVAVKCISFASDGVTCAAGTSDGNVYLYDLRNVSSGPLSQLSFVPKSGTPASSFPVLNVKFTSKTTAGPQTMTNGHTPSNSNTVQADKAVVGTEVSEKSLPPVASAAPIPPGPTKENVSRPQTLSRDVPLTCANTASMSAESDGEAQTNADPAALAGQSLESALRVLSNISSSNMAMDDAATAGNVSSTPAGSHNITVNQLALERMIQDEVDDLREDMANAMRNMHVDMLRQFQRQSDEMKELFAKQSNTIEALMEQNRLLREENERLNLPRYGEY